jgi:hypothetical protein
MKKCQEETEQVHEVWDQEQGEQQAIALDILHQDT